MLRINLLPPTRRERFWWIITGILSVLLAIPRIVFILVASLPLIVYSIVLLLIGLPYFCAQSMWERVVGLIHRPRGVDTAVTGAEVESFIRRYDEFLNRSLSQIRSQPDIGDANKQSEFQQLFWQLQSRAGWFVTITDGIVRDFCRRRAPDVELPAVSSLWKTPDRQHTVAVGMLAGKLHRTPITQCSRFLRYQCPNQWSHLAVTDRPDIRFCESCKKNVYLCESEEEVAQHKGDCVAFLVRDGRSYRVTMGET